MVRLGRFAAQPNAAQAAEDVRLACGYQKYADGKRTLLACTPDRTWSDFGREGDPDNTFLAYYPGDKYVDILGLV